MHEIVTKRNKHWYKDRLNLNTHPATWHERTSDRLIQFLLRRPIMFRNRNGFTLVELLVVIAIIGILTLLP